MKYLLIIATSLALIMPPVFAAGASSEPVKKGKLMLAKKKDHNKPAGKPTQPAKKTDKKVKK